MYTLPLSVVRVPAMCIFPLDDTGIALFGNCLGCTAYCTHCIQLRESLHLWNPAPAFSSLLVRIIINHDLGKHICAPLADFLDLDITGWLNSPSYRYSRSNCYHVHNKLQIKKPNASTVFSQPPARHQSSLYMTQVYIHVGVLF